MWSLFSSFPFTKSNWRHPWLASHLLKIKLYHYTSTHDDTSSVTMPSLLHHLWPSCCLLWSDSHFSAKYHTIPIMKILQLWKEGCRLSYQAYHKGIITYQRINQPKHRDKLAGEFANLSIHLHNKELWKILRTHRISWSAGWRWH